MQPNTVHWTYDTYMLAKSTGGGWSRPAATVGSSSPPTTPSAMRWNATPANFVKAQGGKVVGGALSLPGDTDFSSFLLQAQASRAKVIGLANASAIR